MHQYYYELQIYEDLICGELEPVRLHGDKIEIGRQYLNDEVGECQDMQILKLRNIKGNVEVLEKLNISNAHPLANKYFLQRDFGFENDIEELFSKKVISELDINPDKVHFTVTKENNKVHFVGVCEHSSWNDINQQRIKYYYYYQILADCKKKLKRSIHLAVFELQEIEFQKLICNIQKTLMYYIKELKKTHQINPELLDYKVKETYTDQDCISLVYMSLIELLNYLYENHHNEFDKTFPVPYYSEKINVNHIDEKIKLIEKILDEQKIDPVLKGILAEQFQRIIGFNHPKRLTYHELDYFIQLLSQLTKYLVTFKDSGISGDNIISILISFKFNNFRFIQYVTNEIRKDLETIGELNQKRIYLLEQKKIVDQSFEAIQVQYDPSSNEVSKVIGAWIEKEIKLIEEYIANLKNKNETQYTETLKLETSLSAKQLAALIKTLSDCDIIVSKSQSELARWISTNFKNTNTDNISISQLRNHLYNKDPIVLEKVKNLAIEMINVINEKLSAKY